ncbi:MAG: Crp/Fnr family transcriptional regulator [Hyphomonadaceae bacterium]|nr:Crp/Fnr family transcriptional regulator [Hyphomonadaceae bacterium]
MTVRSDLAALFRPELTGATAGGADPGLALLQNACAALRLRRRQRLVITREAEVFYLVRSGLLLVSATASARHRTMLSLLFPGDIFRTGHAPPLAGVALTVATTTEVGRLDGKTAEQLIEGEPKIRHFVARRSTDLLARQMLHVAAVGALSGEERTASFLIEVAMRTGHLTACGVVFDLAMARSDIADHLALNADTLSRIMSRLKAKGVLAAATRGRAIIKDWQSLCAMTPIAGALQQMAGQRREGLSGSTQR